ncbi:MAG: bifunctional homocysteine S-methyltransferase/methylenetetrahydrofolate reductase, partial [bacterium]|nr:bifunctional homocysteine S-methyltransferase/methylenetetrahydrofolate reductase [bacterium]
MTQRVLDRLRTHVVVADGAMGSELLASVEDETQLELAPVMHPKSVLEAHLRYLEAGAEIIETATFGASRLRLERHHAGDLAEKVNSEAVKLAREAREISGSDCLVAGSIGPLAGVVDLDEAEGRLLIPSAHAEQATHLVGRGADLIVLETFFRLDELLLAIRAVRSVTDLPIVAMLTFAAERPPHAYREQAVLLDEVADADVAAIGVNCSPGPMGSLEILRQVQSTNVPLAAMPNAGELLRRDGRILMPPATPSYLARFARNAASLGASIIGGCCGTGPDHIKAMADEVRGVVPMRHSQTKISVEEVVAPVPQVRAPQSSLAEKLAQSQFVKMVQLDPPKGTNADAVVEATKVLAD